MSGNANSGRRRRLKPDVSGDIPAPPAGLTAAERQVWIDTAPIVAKRVALETVQHFLKNYCRATVAVERAAVAMRKQPLNINAVKVWRQTFNLVETSSKHLGLSPLSARHVLAAQKAEQALSRQGTWRDRIE